MESSRDSSFWRGLAVAFGDGLAFGVGMKLSQNASRIQATRKTAPGPAPVAEWLESIERRLARMERAPASAPGSRPALDQKVLEAVVGSLDTRLKENTVQVERRLTDLEARIAVELQSLDRQDQSIASGAQASDDETRRQFAEHVADLRQRLEQEIGALHEQVVALNREFAEAVAQIVDRQVAAAVDTGLQALEHALEAKVAEAAQSELRPLAAQLAVDMDQRLAGLERRVAFTLDARIGEAGRQIASAVDARLGSLEGELASALDARVEAAVETRAGGLELQIAAAVTARLGELEQQIAASVRSEFASLEQELRAELDTRDRALAGLRQHLADSDRAAMDFVLAVGELCRTAAARSSGGAVPPAPKPIAPPLSLDEASPPADPPPPEGSVGAAGPPPAAGPEAPLPAFAQARTEPSWRFPLVSSLLLVCAGVFLLRLI